MIRQKITAPEIRRKTEAEPPIAKNKLRIIPLGGQEEVGRNMTVFEYEDNIVILDMGLQFPEEDMPGIDYIIPDTHYL
ncbi:MAG: ribonuclease J, partial [Candidatus Azambacteria bacterium]|nr:ribonuclease J [Candidatus Azambacteria bacterium]